MLVASSSSVWPGWALKEKRSRRSCAVISGLRSTVITLLVNNCFKGSHKPKAIFDFRLLLPRETEVEKTGLTLIFDTNPGKLLRQIDLAPVRSVENARKVQNDPH
jgi:hypothetical protein